VVADDHVTPEQVEHRARLVKQTIDASYDALGLDRPVYSDECLRTVAEGLLVDEVRRRRRFER
jgi:hypothetical protein